MGVAFGLVQRLTTGEHEIRTAQQVGFLDLERRRRVGERAQFIHAVVDDSLRLQVVGEPHRHGRVIPEYVVRDPLAREKVVQQLAHDRRVLRI